MLESFLNRKDDVMSLVIGIVDKDKVIFASDSQITIGGVRKVSCVEENFKIWHPDDKTNIMMGTVGYVREMNITKSTDSLIDELEYLKEKVDLKYISIKLVKKILKNLKDNHVISEKDNIMTMNNEYLFAYKEKLYQIFSSGAVMEIDKYTAIGSGGNEALASLKNSEGMEAIKRIKLAMDAASNNDIYVDYPLIIGTTDKQDMIIIESSDHKK